jgi:hypothetical protein
VEGNEMSVPSKRTINKRLKGLRELIDSSRDPVVVRIAYAMETAIIWATHDTHGWNSPAQDAIELATILRIEMNEKSDPWRNKQ